MAELFLDGNGRWKPAGAKGTNTKGLGGTGLGLTVDGILQSTGAYKWLSDEIIAGAKVVTGQDNAHGHKGRNIKSVGGVSYDINTPEGLRGYRKALKDGAKPSRPAQSSGSGVTYSADGKTYTDSHGVTWDVATGQAINPKTGKISENGYSIDPKTGERTDSSAPPTTPPSDQPTGRDTPAPDGSGAKGTTTGFKGFEIDLDKANTLLGGIGVRPMADVNTFFSEPVSS